MDFVIVDEGAMHPHRQPGARGQVEHVTVPQQLLRPALVQYRAGIDLGRHLERHPGRNVGLDQAGDNVHRWPLRRKDEVDACGTGFLGDSRNKLLDLLADDHHHVGKFVDDHHDERQGFQFRAFLLVVRQVLIRFPGRIEQWFTCCGCIPNLTVVASQVAYSQARQQPIPALHFRHTPAQRVGRVFHIGDHRRQQMRNTIIDAQLKHLGVDHDETNFFGSGFQQHAQYHGVDAHRLAGTGCAGHQQVGHLRQIGHHWIAANIVTQRQGQGRRRVLEHPGVQHLTEPDHFPLFVRYFDPHYRLARNHLNHANTEDRQGTGKILRQIGNLADLDAGRGFYLKPGNNRPWVNLDHFHGNAEIREFFFQQPRHVLKRLLGIAPFLVLLRRVQKGNGRNGAFNVFQQRRLLAFDAIGAASRLIIPLERRYFQGFPGRLGIPLCRRFGHRCRVILGAEAFQPRRFGIINWQYSFQARLFSLRAGC